MSEKKDIKVIVNPHFVASSLWISSFQEPFSPQAISRGNYAAKRGVPRLLELLKEYDLPSTWAAPIHSLESYPKATEMLLKAGVELVPNGYLHEIPALLSREQESDLLDKEIDAITKLTGKKPVGRVAPNWNLSPNSIDLLLEKGFTWESSQMEDDFHPYYLRKGDMWNGPDYEKPCAEWMHPWKAGEEVDLVEIPANWHLDDSPLVNFALMIPNAYGWATGEQIESLWKDQFDWAYENLDDAIVPLYLHPMAAAKPHVLKMLDRLIPHMLEKKGVRFITMGEAAEDFRAKHPFGKKAKKGVAEEPAGL